MSQQSTAGQATTNNGPKTAQAPKEKVELTKSFTSPAVAPHINSKHLIQLMANYGIMYDVTKASYVSMNANAAIVEDIKVFLANYFHQQKIDIKKNVEATKAINAMFDTSLIKTAYDSGYYSQQIIGSFVSQGVLTQERVQAIFNTLNQVYGQPGYGPTGMNGFYNVNPYQQPMAGGYAYPQQQAAPTASSQKQPWELINDGEVPQQPNPMGMPQQPIYGGFQQQFAPQQPMYGYQQQFVPQQPMYGYQQPMYGYQQPVYGYQQPAPQVQQPWAEQGV